MDNYNEMYSNILKQNDENLYTNEPYTMEYSKYTPKNYTEHIVVYGDINTSGGEWIKKCQTGKR